ncbi:MAG: hypothetical protein Q9164_002524 [Protoblastenia rupestris]
MPRPLIPHHSGVHRAACFALYRALLRQKKHLDPCKVVRLGYDACIGKVFRRNSKVLGQEKATIALNLGYKTLKALRDEGLQQHTLALLAGIPLPYSKARNKPRPALNSEYDPAVQYRHSTHAERLGAGPLLERPHVNISGRRHIPKIVNACRFPFLRIKKPQPAQLSRMIGDSITARESRISRSDELQKQIWTAEDEDQWDAILSKELGVSESSGNGSWITAPRAALDIIRQSHERAIKKRIDMAVRMTDIVEKEAALATEEKRRRLDMAHKKRKARRLERQGRDPALAWDPSQGPEGKGAVVAWKPSQAPKEKGYNIAQDRQSTRPVGIFPRPDRATVLAERARRKEERAKTQEAKAKRKEEQAMLHQQRPAENGKSVSEKEDDTRSVSRKPVRAHSPRRGDVQRGRTEKPSGISILEAMKGERSWSRNADRTGPTLRTKALPT